VRSKRSVQVGVGAFAALALLVGCGGSGDSGADDSDRTTTQTTAAPATTAQATDAHNMADAMFSQHMIPHHQQAIEMSDMLLAKQGIDPRVTELATQIKAAQGPEIEQMRGWLREWGMPAMPGGDMGGHGAMGGMGDMPGMAGMMSEADMTALQNAEGVDATKLFLTQMIEHHEGAITMAQNEIDDGQFPATVELAHSIIETQQREIDTMKQILQTL